MKQVKKIPIHTRCQNCGECCGLIPATPEEVEAIQRYLRRHEDAQRLAAAQSGRLECPFRDKENRRCTIYPVRPAICRLFGVTLGMRCKYGNSAQIDGRPFLSGHSLRTAQILNHLDWT